VLRLPKDLRHGACRPLETWRCAPLRPPWRECGECRRLRFSPCRIARSRAFPRIHGGRIDIGAFVLAGVVLICAGLWLSILSNPRRFSLAPRADRQIHFCQPPGMYALSQGPCCSLRREATRRNLCPRKRGRTPTLAWESSSFFSWADCVCSQVGRVVP
jgi:hypothetical protein